MELRWLDYILNQLAVYRAERRIDVEAQYSILPTTLKEEYEEFINGGDENEMIDAIADMLVLSFNAKHFFNQERIEYLVDTIEFTSPRELVDKAYTLLSDIENTNDELYEEGIASLLLILEKGYAVDSGLVMHEVVKHIMCRKQDPEQYERWIKNPDIKEKWLKDKNQPEHEIYQPDYNKCKYQTLF